MGWLASQAHYRTKTSAPTNRYPAVRSATPRECLRPSRSADARANPPTEAPRGCNLKYDTQIHRDAAPRRPSILPTPISTEDFIPPLQQHQRPARRPKAPQRQRATGDHGEPGRVTQVTPPIVGRTPQPHPPPPGKRRGACRARRCRLGSPASNPVERCGGSSRRDEPARAKCRRPRVASRLDQA